jgi:DMSO/TMAO reductase YedYZ heme-binding membrane subunit
MSPSDARSIAGPLDARGATPAARRAQRTRWLEGWPLTLALSALVVALAAAIVLAGRGGAGALGLAIRVTARTSFALFLGAFTASAAHRLWPGRFTRWQRRNRRYLGVAFAASHLAHGAAILALAALHPAAFHDRAGAMSQLPGLVGYGLLLAMTATSFDRTAAWLGPRAWKALHTVGSLYLWGAFANAFVSRALRMPAYGPAAALAIAAMALRIVAWRRGARAR